MRRPGRTVLTLLSVIIGVAAMVAVSISTRTARLAYQQMFSAVTGTADLEITSGGKEGFPESVVADLKNLRTADGKSVVDVAVPMIYRPGLLSVPGRRIKVYALGIDAANDKKVRDYKITEGREMSGEREMLMDTSFARTSKVKVGDSVRFIGAKSGLIKFEVVGLVSPQQAAALKYSGMVLMPLTVAQEIFNDSENVDRVQIVLNHELDADQAIPLVRGVVPSELKVDAPNESSAIMQETQLSSEEGLKLSGAFTVVLAVFIIFNTFLMNVGERKSQLSVMRAIGSTRTQVVMMILRESFVLGLIGSLIGMVVGYFFGILLNLATSALLQSPLPKPPFSLEPFIIGLCVGMAISVLSAVIPALLASFVTPLEGMRNITTSRSHSMLPWIGTAGVLMVIMSAVLLYLSITGLISIDYASPAGVLMNFGGVLVAPLIMVPFARLAAIPLGWMAPLEAGLALKQLLRHRLRTSMTMGVLLVAGSTGVGMASSLIDTIDDVRQWSRVAIVGDFFIRAAMPDSSTGLAPDLPDEVGEDLKKLPHITHIETVSFVQGRIGEQDAVIIARDYTLDKEPPFDLVSGDLQTLRAELMAGDAVIGSVLAERMQAKQGDLLSLGGKDGVTKIRVAGVANDYLGGGLSVHLQRKVAERLLGIKGVDGYILAVDRAHAAELEAPLQKICDDYGATLHSNADITEMIEGMMRGIDFSLWGLVYLGFIVASFGVVNTLTMNVLEQTREIGLLRITGMTRRQVRRTIAMQACILGLIGVTPGIVMGLATAWLMNQAMGPSLGHPVEFQIHPWLMITSWIGSMLIVLLAALIPALRASRIDVVTALHYE